MVVVDGCTFPTTSQRSRSKQVQEGSEYRKHNGQPASQTVNQPLGGEAWEATMGPLTQTLLLSLQLTASLSPKLCIRFFFAVVQATVERIKEWMSPVLKEGGSQSTYDIQASIPSYFGRW